MRRTGWPGQGLGMVPCGRRSGLAAWGTAAALCLGASATADVTGLEAEHWIKTIGGVDYHVADVYARCENEGDKLLLVWNTVIVLSAAPNATFFNAPLPGGIETARPVCWDELWDPTWQVDTYFGLGGEQCDTSGVQWLTPDCPTDLLVDTGVVQTPGGWFNVPPTLAVQHAGPDLRVRLVRLCVREDDWEHGATIACGWRIAWKEAGGTGSEYDDFGTIFTMPDAAPSEPPDDLPGEGDVAGGDEGGGNETAPPVAFGPVDAANLFWFSPGGWIFGVAVDSSFALSEPATIEHQADPDDLPQGRGDLDGDGDDDFLFRDTASERMHAWIMQDGLFVEDRDLGPVPTPLAHQWQVLGVADCDGDGSDDVVWRREDTGNRLVRLWRMANGAIASVHDLGMSPGFEFLGVGDLNKDGRADLLWRDPQGTIIAWRTNPDLTRTVLLFGNVPAIASAWRAEALLDLDGDGDCDMVWHRTDTGQVNGWIVEGLARVAGGPIASGVPGAFRVIETPDLDADGDQDLVWRSSISGSVNLWQLTGLNKECGGFLTMLPGAWLAW